MRLDIVYRVGALRKCMAYPFLTTQRDVITCATRAHTHNTHHNAPAKEGLTCIIVLLFSNLFTLLSSLCAKKDYTVLCALFHACFTPCGGRIMTDRTCIRFSCRVIHRKSSQTLISLSLSLSPAPSLALSPLPFPPSPSYMHMHTLTLSSWPFYWKLKIPRLRNLSLCLKLGCGILLFAIKTLYNNSAFGGLSIRMDYKDLYNSGEQNDTINISGEKYIATMILYSKKKRRETLHGSEGLSERCFSVQQVKSLKKKKTGCRGPLISGKMI